MQTVFATSKGATEALMAASVHQKEIVAQMMSSNPEDSISLALAASIEAYGKQLENINAWTEGGAAVIDPMLLMMYEGIISDGVDGTEFEDLVQIMLIDMLINYPDALSDISGAEIGYVFEFLGSGQHKNRSDNVVSQEQLSDIMYKVFQAALSCPEGSTAHITASYLDENYDVASEFDNCMDNYWSDPDGFYVGDDGYTESDGQTTNPDCTELCPFMRMLILSTSVDSGDPLTPEEWETIITGTPQEINDLLGMNAYIYIVTYNDDWSWYSPGGGGEFDQPGYWLDYPGGGVDADYINNMFNEFPARELTEEEIEEVNRIGDQVKMLQQTLLYWLKICRDEQMAIARNT